MELVRTAATYRAGIRCDGAKLKAETGEDARVSVIHNAVSLFQARIIRMKGISVLHQEFARAHHAETRAHFVAELGLNLVEIDR